MKTILTFDGLKTDVFETGPSDTQTLMPQQFDKGITPVQQPTELGETLKELNKDHIDPNTRMSAIDMRSRLHYAEIGALLALDSLVSLGILPTKCLAFSRQKKRLSVSEGGRGREDFINVVAGKRESDKAMMGNMMGGMKDRTMNFMGFNQK